MRYNGTTWYRDTKSLSTTLSFGIVSIDYVTYQNNWNFGSHFYRFGSNLYIISISVRINMLSGQILQV